MTHPDDDLKELWQTQSIPSSELKMDAILGKATNFQSKIRNRNLAEYVAGAFVATFFGRIAIVEGALLIRIGALLLVVGTAVMLTNIRLRGHAAEQPAAAVPTAELLAWHRKELERQMQLLLQVPRWYVGPLIPGLVVFFAGGLERSDLGSLIRFGISFVVCGVMTGLILWANRRAARELKKQIDELKE